MPIFPSGVITRFQQEGETKFAVDHPCIIERVALAIVAGTSEYTLDDKVLSVKKITWKGTKIDPATHKSLRRTGLSGSQAGKPYEYIFNNIGKQKIKFFPTPQETIATITTDLYGSEIANRVIVEYYRTPDFSSTTIPPVFRRRLLKAYVLSMCYLIEGKGQDIKVAAYFKKRYQFLDELYWSRMLELIQVHRYVAQGSESGDYRDPKSAILSEKYWQYIDNEY